ncbi:MAG: CNNM domain-containing protein [Fuerstiella sp.]
MTSLVLLILTFLAVSGLLAAVDAAILSVTAPEIHELRLHGKRGADALYRVRKELTRAVVVVVIVTNTVNVVGPILVSQQAVATYGPGILGVISVVLTLGTIVFSEIIPKSLGTHYATDIGRTAALPIRFLQTMLHPLVVSLEWLSKQFTRGTRHIGTEEQIRSLTAIGRRAGYIEQDEHHLINRVFVLNDMTAADIMTPLKEVVSIHHSTTIGEAARQVRSTAFSRYPVFGDSTDDVVGIALIRDILEAVADGRGTESICEVTRPAFSVAARTGTDELLPRFRGRHIHLAVVKNGAETVGVVSLEDVLEQLVGNIEDERDAELR